MSSPSPPAAAAAASALPAVSPPLPITSLPASTPSAMPAHMYYTSLEWLSTSAGVPLASSETPPTSPDRARGTRPGAETPEQRRERQAAFIKEKNRELAELKKKVASGALLEEAVAEACSSSSSSAAPAAASAAEETEEAPFTPVKKAVASPSQVAAQQDAAPTFMSPEKRRAKKLSSLQYPLFSAYWWDAPVEKSASSSSSGKKGKGEEESLGLVLLGGGGGKKGAGIDSGMLVCSVLPSTSSIFSHASSPIRMSNNSSKTLALNPVSFLDSNDFLIGAISPHPHLPVLAATVGAGTAILEASGSDAANVRFSYSKAVQTDFHKELCAQAQAWSPSGSWIATGGEDRVIRLWSYPSLELLAVCSGNALGLDEKAEQHRNPLLSLHVNHDGTRLASCAGDGFIKIWNTSKLEGIEDDLEGEPEETEAAAGEEEEKKASDKPAILRCPLVQNITIQVPKGSVLKFQAARFYGKARLSAPKAAEKKKQKSKAKGERKGEEGDEGEEEEESDSDEESDEPFVRSEEYLIAIASAIQRGGGSSYLVKYQCSDWSRVKQVSLGSAGLTTMEMSDDTHKPYVALANTDGLVAIYAAHTLNCIKRVQKCHDLPTTALAFSPVSLSSPDRPRWLLSASADKSVALIEVPSLQQQSSSSLSKKLLIVAFLVLLLAYVLHHFKLIDLNKEQK